MTKIYTDGACSGNPGPGGWAAVIVVDGKIERLSGGEDRTTNNRMEMLAAIEGLGAVPPSSAVTVFSDSRLLVNTMTLGWKRNKNRDLWERLDDAAATRRVSWQWVKGHAGDPLNQEADRLAVMESKRRGTSGSRQQETFAQPRDSGEGAGHASRRRLAGRQPSPSPQPSPVKGEGVNARASQRREQPARGGSGDEPGLSHVDDSGEARMVDVGEKPETKRVAVAKGSVLMRGETLELVAANRFEKGDVLGIARVAGIMAAKNTSQLIPLCHPLPLDQVLVEFDLDEKRGAVDITATARTTAKTGVEMEALTAVSVAALTVYDMCKSSDRAMRIDGVRLASKSGGRSGDFVLEP
jgi:cyclic pyranopterin phosphate synthase